MKTIAFITVTLMALLLPVLAFGAPWLVCDPQAGVEQYGLEINGVEGAAFAAEADGSIRYDLAGLVEDSYTVRAKAGNIWGGPTGPSLSISPRRSRRTL